MWRIDETGFAGDLARTVLRRIGRQLADRESEVFPRPFEPFPFVVEPLDKRDGRRDRVATRSPRLGTGMRIGTEAPCPAKTQTTADAADDPDGKALGLENRALLNMQLDIAAQPRRVEKRRARAHGSNVATGVTHVLCERAAGVGAPHVERG